MRLRLIAAASDAGSKTAGRNSPATTGVVMHSERRIGGRRERPSDRRMSTIMSSRADGSNGVLVWRSVLTARTPCNSRAVKNSTPATQTPAAAAVSARKSNGLASATAVGAVSAVGAAAGTGRVAGVSPRRLDRRIAAPHRPVEQFLRLHAGRPDDRFMQGLRSAVRGGHWFASIGGPRADRGRLGAGPRENPSMPLRWEDNAVSGQTSANPRQASQTACCAAGRRRSSAPLTRAATSTAAVICTNRFTARQVAQSPGQSTWMSNVMTGSPLRYR